MDIETRCIEWTGATVEGYGVRKVDGQRVLVHRLAYCEANGVSLDSITEFVVRHKCDNRCCYNPEHLELGTPAQNSQDMVDRDRQAKGEAVASHKLSKEQVEQIRARYIPRHRVHGQRALALVYGVSQSAISLIINEKNWRH